jgi:hypothetical protein
MRWLTKGKLQVDGNGLRSQLFPTKHTDFGFYAKPG